MKKITLFLLLFLLTNFIFSQTLEEDSYNSKKLKEFTDRNNDSIIFYANKLKKSKNLCNYYHAMNMEAKAFYQKNNLELAKKKTLTVLESIKNENKNCFQKNKITALTRLFWIYKNQIKFQDAFNVLLERKKIINSLHIKDNYYHANLISTDHNLAIIKSVLGLHEEARSILKEILPKLPVIYKDLEKEDYFLKLNMSSTLNLIGESYLETNKNSSELDSASTYFKKAYQITKSFTPIHKNSETLYVLREVEVLIAKKKFKEALNIIDLYDKNTEEFKTTQNINSLKAICFYQLKKNDSSLYYANRFLQKHKNSKSNKKRLIAIYDILSNEYYKNKQLDSAYKYSELTIAELNILKINKEKVNKSHYLYDYKNAQSLNKLIIEKGKGSRKNFFAVILLIAFIGILIIYGLLKSNKKTKKDLISAKINWKPTPTKTAYNIDHALEKSLLKGINELESSTDYLKASFTIKTLAKKLNTNTSYLSYILNKEYNQSFKQYITKLRIEYLIQKLKSDSKFKNYTIKSLAEEIGYTNASAFTRAFKKYKGITPSEFIKALDS